MKSTSLIFLFFLTFSVFAQTTDVVYPFACSEQWGLMNDKKEIILEPALMSISLFHEDNAMAQKDSRFGLINKKGAWVLAPTFDSLRLFNRISWDYFYISKLNGKFGLIRTYSDKRAPIVTHQPIFEKIESIQRKHNFMVGQINGKKGLFALSGKKILPAKFDKIEIAYFFDEWEGGSLLGPTIKTVSGSQTKYYELDGRPKAAIHLFAEKNPPMEASASNRGDAYHSTVELVNGSWHLKYQDQKGKELLATEFVGPDEIIRTHHYGKPSAQYVHLIAKKNGLLAVLSVDGQLLTDYVFEEIEDEYQTKIAKTKGLYGLINNNFNWSLPPIFSKMERVKNGLLFVEHPDGCKGYVFKGQVFLPKTIDLTVPERTVPYLEWKSDKAVSPGLPPTCKIDLEAFLKKESSMKFKLGRKVKSSKKDVLLFFRVDKQGNVSNDCTVLRGSEDKQAEVRRLFSLFPSPWNPGVSSGYIVNSKAILVFLFE